MFNLPGTDCQVSNEARLKIGQMVSDWLIARDGVDAGEFGEDMTDPVRAVEMEFSLHHLLRADHPGVVFNCSGIALWVDPSTPAGTVRAYETVSIG